MNCIWYFIATEKSIVEAQGRRQFGGVPKSGNVYIEENGGSKC